MYGLQTEFPGNISGSPKRIQDHVAPNRPILPSHSKLSTEVTLLDAQRYDEVTKRGLNWLDGAGIGDYIDSISRLSGADREITMITFLHYLAKEMKHKQEISTKA